MVNVDRVLLLPHSTYTHRVGLHGCALKRAKMLQEPFLFHAAIIISGEDCGLEHVSKCKEYISGGGGAVVTTAFKAPTDSPSNTCTWQAGGEDHVLLSLMGGRQRERLDDSLLGGSGCARPAAPGWSEEAHADEGFAWGLLPWADLGILVEEETWRIYDFFHVYIPFQLFLIA